MTSSLRSLDQLNKPASSDSSSEGKREKSFPELSRSEKMGKSLLAAASLRNSGKKGGVPQKSEEQEKKDRLTKIYKIKKYLERFPELRNVARMPSATTSDAELDQIVFDIHQYMNCASSERYIPLTVTQLFNGIEVATMQYNFNPLNLDLTGLSAAMQSPKVSANLMNIATEIYIEYQHWFSHGPFVRFMAEAIGLMLTVDSINKSRSTVITAEQMKQVEKELDAGDNNNTK